MVNGRLSAGSFREVPTHSAPWCDDIFQDVALAAVQTREYGERFAGPGDPPGAISGGESSSGKAASLESPELREAAERLARGAGVRPPAPPR